MDVYVALAALSGILLLFYILGRVAIGDTTREEVRLSPFFVYPFWARLLACTFVIPALALAFILFGLLLLGADIYIITMALNDVARIAAGVFLIIWFFYALAMLMDGGRNGTRSPS